MTKQLRIQVVDDHDVVRAGVISFLNGHDDLTVVGDAANGKDALALVEALEPDVVVLDVRLGDDDGIEVCREIKAARPDTVVLMFTSFADADALEAAMVAGANGYLLKRISMDDLVDGIRRAAAGETLLEQEASDLLSRRMRGDTSADPRLAKLSPQERTVLRLIAEGRTNRQIAEEMSLAEKTVKNYVSNLLRKLDMRRRSEAAAFRASLPES